jgi:hypothetical protein
MGTEEEIAGYHLMQPCLLTPGQSQEKEQAPKGKGTERKTKRETSQNT